MAISSMTGFSRSEGSHNSLSWAWEIKSVNGRGLDARFRLPPGFDALEIQARERLKKYITRGSLHIVWSYEKSQGENVLTLNEDVLNDIIRISNEIGERLGRSEQPSLDTLLSFRGVVDAQQSSDTGLSDDDDTREKILESFEQALKDLLKSRQAEGGALFHVVSGQIDQIEQLVKRAEANTARTPEMIAQRLQKQIDALLEAHQSFDKDRLYQEAVLIATKADIREEIDRLYAHVATARDLLKSDVAIGRKLDFLAQEFNREANTLCSKSNDKSITSIGLELKTVIDQLREQVQNVE